MKKALRIGAASVALAAVATCGAIFNLGHTNETDFAVSPYVQTAVLKQGATGGEVKVTACVVFCIYHVFVLHGGTFSPFFVCKT